MSHAAPQSPDDALDQWLVLRVQAGDEQALRRLYARWATRLHRHAVRMTGDRDAAADASQEAWLAIVRGIDRLNDPACFRRWAYRIVGRKCADWVRRRQRTRATTEPLSDEPTSPTEPESSTEETDALRHTLKRLPNQDRVLLAMHYADDMPLAEIAEAVGLPLGTVKSRLYHARQRLKQALKTKEPTATAKELNDER